MARSPSPAEMACDFEEGGGAARERARFLSVKLSISYLYLYECRYDLGFHIHNFKSVISFTAP